jgi:class 3 adenylate cyclase
MLQYARVLGSASARVAEAALALFFANVSPQLRLSEASDLELVRRSAEAVSAFSATPAAMDLLIREHFVTAVRRAGLLDVREGGTSLGTIAFIDLVASTETSRAVTATQWSDALTVFETAAMDAIQARDGRVVKLIGDEAMLFAPTPAAAIDAVDEVLTTVERHPLLGGGRAGVAAGYVVSRDGDYFGPVVNLAARLVGAAAAGEVLLNDEASRSIADGGYPIDAAGDFTLKGFEQPVPVTRFRR